MGRKTAEVNLSGAEIGWHGSKGGKTIEVHFRDGDERLGSIRLSEAALWWKPKGARGWTGKRRVSVTRLFELLDNHA